MKSLRRHWYYWDFMVLHGLHGGTLAYIMRTVWGSAPIPQEEKTDSKNAVQSEFPRSFLFFLYYLYSYFRAVHRIGV